MEIASFDDGNDYLMDSFIEETKNTYTDEKVYSFMENSFKDKKEIKSDELKIKNFDALICLILATVKSEDESSFYEIKELLPKQIKNNDFIIPNFAYRRKDDKEEK